MSYHVNDVRTSDEYQYEFFSIILIWFLRCKLSRFSMSEEEVYFAQHLASNEPRIRNKSLARLKKWLKLRSQTDEAEFSFDGMMKLWKGTWLYSIARSIFIYSSIRMSMLSCIQTKHAIEHLAGLFYCMWMADKPLIQEELADSISSLINMFAKPSQSYRFIEAFFKTLGRNHDNIDKFRIDKFLMLVRRFLR